MTAALASHLTATVFAIWFLVARVGLRISVTSILLVALIVVHGLPLSIYLTTTGPDTFVYEAALAYVDADEVRSRLAYALALTFVAVVAGIQITNVLLRDWERRVQVASAVRSVGRNDQIRIASPVRIGLWSVVIAMATVSLAEGQLQKIWLYFVSDESEMGKIALRAAFGGAPYYWYNLLLASVAPFLVMAAYCVRRGDARALDGLALFISLLAMTLLGKFGTLSKAPPVIFVAQFLLFLMLLKRMRLSAASIMLLILATLLLFFLFVYASVPELGAMDTIRFLNYRIFDIPNESLLEYFAAIPAMIDHGWGSGLLPFLRAKSDSDFVPMYLAVAELIRGSYESTSNAMFIADAWAEFGWAGVLAFSILAGAIARSIDLYAFRNGESEEAACLVAGCSFGVFTLMSTSLTTAMVTGGLLLLPVLSFVIFGSDGQLRGLPSSNDEKRTELTKV